MSASVTGKKQCVTCSKSGGIMICDGCQQSFCGKHSIEHRQELTNRLDVIMQEHDLLQQELRQSSNENSLLNQINKWEEESITKIQVAAEAARTDLQRILDRSRETISKTCRDIAVSLCSSREADDFSENDLIQWTIQLKELQLELKFDSPPSVNLVENKISSIPLIEVKHSSFTSKKSAKQGQIFREKIPTISIVQEKFSQMFGEGVIIEEDGTVIRHMGKIGQYVHVLGERLYSQNRHVVTVQVEYDHLIYDTFLGCISFQSENNKPSYRSPASTGWFGQKEVYHQGKIIANGYDSSCIKSNDILCVTFDCENRQIELYHERTNKIYTLPIDIKYAPFPWQLIVVLCHPNGTVRIIPNN